MENSPIALAFLQLVLALAHALLYARQRSKGETLLRDVDGFRLDLDRAVSAAERAERGVETIEVKHYKALAIQYAECCSEQAASKAKLLNLEESVASLSNKLASRDRADRSAEKKAAKAPFEDADEIEYPAAVKPGGIDRATLERLGAIPLQPNPAASAAPRVSNFGKSAR